MNTEEIRAIAVKLLGDSPRKREAVEGGYYTLLLNWPYREIERSRIPAGVPVELIERWSNNKRKDRQ